MISDGVAIEDITDDENNSNGYVLIDIIVI